MLQKVRDNDNFMKLSRMGSRYPSRLSFSRSMLRRLINDKWEIHKSKFDLDKDGYGTVVYEIIVNKDTYSLVCFSAFLDDKDRSDRVIADKWDTAYTLHIGKLSNEDLNRLKKTIPLQESGRNSPDELILSRANKSVRLFQYVVDCLSKGNQPDINEINKVGYLLRTTAVYGSGKFGLSDFTNTKNTTVFNQPFRAEMLSVYLIREFSVELVEHVAKQINPEKAVKLDRKIKQHFGIGNSTGLGMAPFIIKHPKLINKWMIQYTKTLQKIAQINLGDEIQKSGIPPNELESFYKSCKLLRLNIIGTMCIPPQNKDPKIYFNQILKLNKKIGLKELSMGMTNDYLDALEYNSSFLRIGSGIFGPRSKKF